jgi:hypothetical protein
MQDNNQQSNFREHFSREDLSRGQNCDWQAIQGTRNLNGFNLPRLIQQDKYVHINELVGLFVRFPFLAHKLF